MQAQAAISLLNFVRKLWKTRIFPRKPPSPPGNPRLSYFGIGFHFPLASDPLLP
jgi:hypothetical protein